MGSFGSIKAELANVSWQIRLTDWQIEMHGQTWKGSPTRENNTFQQEKYSWGGPLIVDITKWWKKNKQ